MTNRLPLIALATVLVAVGCKPKATPEASATQEKPSTAGATAKPTPTPEPEPQPEPKPEPECRDDRQCDGYMRCEDRKCVVPPAVDGRVVEGMPTATFESAGEPLAQIKLEIADDPWEMTRGLMFRRKMDPGFGMLFVYPDEQVRSFWMKNTYLSLDMVHVDASGEVVGVVANAEPMTTSPRRTGEPARYVLELVAGKAEELGIEKGVQMRLENVPEELAPR